ncbi:intermembrane transport protein PqiB [Aliidiomarina quisquiliarum]|uniref:intermembrane transport protein PqiB n=1 Tax=Aliidiomarina quisquiliarum TaxID=2938947 RepID=UPI00208F3247|nr:intermembrane transport protein PqiB [Aliidiomarina quisquiliarum]MCO4322267.1 intermembrane transport protein PqiB [Aliidiomarina quisquiliarum]
MEIETRQKIERAERRVGRKISSVWLVPIVALAIGVWMAYDTVTSRGQMITLEVDRAEGIEAGKTLVKAQDVAVGRVEGVRLADTFDFALIDIRMYRDTDRMLNSATEFWVEKPRVGREGISGLSTLLSGTFIQLQPGGAADTKNHFVALTAPPITPADMEGVRIVLQSDDASNLGVGDPILYRGYTVGRIEQVEFEPTSKQMTYQLFVQAPYDSLVTSDVRFWLHSGAQLDLSSRGVRVDIGSLESLLSGGVSFAAFEENTQAGMVTNNASFQLYQNEEEARQARFTEVIHYVILLEDSVRGLNKGSPVEYRGVRVGTVEEVPFQGLHGDTDSILEMKIPILIRFEPERINRSINATTLEDWKKDMDDMFRNGLRASLRAGNLLTGALFVDLNFYPDEVYTVPNLVTDYAYFPSVTNSFTQLDQKFTALLDSLNNIKFSEFIDTATSTLAYSEQTLRTINKTSEQLHKLLEQDAMQELPTVLVSALNELEQTFAGYSTNAPAYNELTQSIEKLNSILRELEPLSETLRDSPRALFFDVRIPQDPKVGSN